jgi:hypothetical protein
MSMGVTALIPGMTFKQLYDEAEERWGEIWDDELSRLQIMLICKRKERKLLELHGDFIDHGQPVIGIFHRPRDEAYLIEEQGLNPKDASFQFLDLANTDLGLWMKNMVTTEGWRRTTIEIVPSPISLGIPNQRTFEKHTIVCFHHPEITQIDRYYLPFPVESVSGKAFVSLPRRQAAELARQQAEILGVGQLKKPKPVIVEAPKATKTAKKPTQDEVFEPTTEVSMEDSFITEMIPDALEEDNAMIPLPGQAHEEVETRHTPLPSEEDIASEMPVIEEPTKSPLEIEFRELITIMLGEGIEPNNMMEDERFANISERAVATGLETWPIFLQMVAL